MVCRGDTPNVTMLALYEKIAYAQLKSEREKYKYLFLSFVPCNRCRPRFDYGRPLQAYPRHFGRVRWIHHCGDDSDPQ